MKMLTSCLLIGLLLILPAWAETPGDPGLKALEREVDSLEQNLESANRQIAELLDRVDVLERRLGDSFKPITPFDTIERRLDDLQKEVDRLKRR